MEPPGLLPVPAGERCMDPVSDGDGKDLGYDVDALQARDFFKRIRVLG